MTLHLSRLVDDDKGDLKSSIERIGAMGVGNGHVKARVIDDGVHCHHWQTIRGHGSCVVLDLCQDDAARFHLGVVDRECLGSTSSGRSILRCDGACDGVSGDSCGDVGSLCHCHVCCHGQRRGFVVGGSVASE